MIIFHKTLVFKKLSIFRYHIQGDYFKSYKAFFNLQNKCSFQGSTKPSSWCMNICSCNFPCRNVVLTSKWLMFQLHCDASIHSSCIVAPLYYWGKSFHIVQTMQLLKTSNNYLSFLHLPFNVVFFLYTHFEDLGLFPLGRNWSVQVLFLWIKFISYCITSLQPSCWRELLP